MIQTLALNPQIQSVLAETKAGDDILSAKAMADVEKYLVDAAGADSENVMAVWIADLDASVITQSDGYTSLDGKRIYHPNAELVQHFELQP